MGNFIGSDRAPMLRSYFLLVFLFMGLSRLGMFFLFFFAHQCSVRFLAFVCGLIFFLRTVEIACSVGFGMS